MRRHLERILEPNYRLALASDGQEGLEKAQALHPDLVVTDAMMPRMSGCDLVQALRQMPSLREVPVLFVTARPVWRGALNV